MIVWNESQKVGCNNSVAAAAAAAAAADAGGGNNIVPLEGTEVDVGYWRGWRYTSRRAKRKLLAQR